MFTTTLRRALCRSTSNAPAASASAFAFTGARTFASSPPVLSQVGRTPVVLPPEVKLIEHPAPPSKSRVKNPRILEISGPLGVTKLPLSDFVTLTMSETTPVKVSVAVADHTKRAQLEMWGTTRALIASAITGVSEGHTAILRLVGVGYRAIMEQDNRVINLKVGYAHPVELKVPEGIKASVPAPTRILLEGKDKQILKNFAAKIRDWRKPEPYKGKGIFINEETIKIKAKKIK